MTTNARLAGVIDVQQRKQHVFGPVPSRRLGRSLGVDLVPHKTCSYDCIYCQLGATTNRTLERGPFVSVNTVLREVEVRLRAAPAPDYITLSGSGEPTLQTGLGALIGGIKRMTDRPVAVLTNGSLLWRDDVQVELLKADLVIPSLDAGDEEMFRRVNRPHPDLSFKQLVEGLVGFRKCFPGQLWLEVFLLGGLTTVDDQLDKIRLVLSEISPDRIQLNTVARPPCENFARPASVAELTRAAQLLGQRTEVIAERPAADITEAVAPRVDEIVALLERRPCTLDDIAAGLGAHRLEVAKHIEQLLRRQVIVMRQHGRQVYYRPASCDIEPDEVAQTWKERRE
jgi:wyosine [tRNA(Phe)-imidazoG37] synthetase (radical SAM superfamily)